MEHERWGRVILNDHLPEQMPFINGLLKKKGPRSAGAALLPEVWAADHGRHARPGEENLGLPVCDPRRLSSIGIDGPWSSPAREEETTGRRRRTRKWWAVEGQYQDGAITPRANAITRSSKIWSAAFTEKVSDEMFRGHGRRRSHRTISQSDLHHGRFRALGGSKQQNPSASPVMRGLMARPSGENHRDAHHGQLP